MNEIKKPEIKKYKWSFYDGKKSVSGEFIRVEDLEKELSSIIKTSIKEYNIQFPTLNPATLTLDNFIAKALHKRIRGEEKQ